MNQRLALLSAILANPDDDLPRLVFADWLEENGTTDADEARVEFIRLGCKSKAKLKISAAETKWLDAHWQRLLGTTLAATHPKTRRQTTSREGRFVRVQFRWQDEERVGVAELVFEYVRGFARRVEYHQGHTYRRFWQAAATDEPLAYHRPELRPAFDGDRMTGWWSRLLPSMWGEEVFDRTSGWGPHSNEGEKVFYPAMKAPPEREGFHPLAAKDEGDLGPCNHRQRAAVATAMTAIAREFVGLTSPAPAA